MSQTRNVFSESELSLFIYLISNSYSSTQENVIGRPSVCRLSVTFVRTTQAIEIFGNVSTPFGEMKSAMI